MMNNIALPLVPSTPVTPTITLGTVYTKTPVALAEVTIQVNTLATITFPLPVLEIKDIKKRLKITEGRLILPTNKLFLSGFVRKNIQYATPTGGNTKEVTSTIQSFTIDLPFSAVTDLTGKYLTAPVLPKGNSRAEVEYFTSTALPPSFPAKDRLLAGDLSEFNQVSTEYFNELPYCELISATYTEMDEALGRVPGTVSGVATPPFEEGTYSSVQEKMVIDITLKVLQLQQIRVTSA